MKPDPVITPVLIGGVTDATADPLITPLIITGGAMLGVAVTPAVASILSSIIVAGSRVGQCEALQSRTEAHRCVLCRPVGK